MGTWLADQPEGPYRARVYAGKEANTKTRTSNQSFEKAGALEGGVALDMLLVLVLVLVLMYPFDHLQNQKYLQIQPTHSFVLVLLHIIALVAEV